MVRAVTYAAAAVHAELRFDPGFPVLHPDSLGGAVFNAIDASPAGFRIQLYRMNKLIHASLLPDVDPICRFSCL